MFLDDDITIDATTFERMWQLLDNGYPIVGCNSVDFPDDSVLYHIYMQHGACLPSYVSASALGITLGPALVPFPYCYNEDWLFIFSYMLRGYQIAWAGSVFQLPYQPFDPLRAISEELGDVLAEGIAYAIVDRAQDCESILHQTEFWQLQIADRVSLIRHLRTAADQDDTPLARPDIKSTLEALDSKYRRDDVDAMVSQLTRFVQLWQGSYMYAAKSETE